MDELTGPRRVHTTPMKVHGALEGSIRTWCQRRIQKAHKVRLATWGEGVTAGVTCRMCLDAERRFVTGYRRRP